MSERIDSWLGSLDRCLRGRVSDSVREARVAEMRGHLHLAVSDRVSSGATSDEAEIASLRNLGMPRVVAAEFIRQARGYSRKSVWLLAWLPILLTLMANVVFLLSFPDRPGWMSIWIVIMNWSGVPVYLAFGWQVWRTRRWLAFPVAVVPLLMLFVALAVYRPVQSTFRIGTTTVFAASSKPEDYRIALQDRLAATKLDLRLAQRISSEVARGGHAPSRPDGYLIPAGTEMSHSGFVPGTIYHPRIQAATTYSIVHAPFVDQAEADKIWRDLGGVAMANLQRQVNDLAHAYSRWQAGPPFDMAQFMFTYGLVFGSVFANFGLLLVLNWAILRLSNSRRAPRQELSHA